MSYQFLIIICLVQYILLPVTSLDYTTKTIKRKNGSVRLIGGDSFNEGNVEIFYLGRWGALCDHLWSNKEASVVCKQLGFSNNYVGISTKSARFGKSKRLYWLSKVVCTGTEDKLNECQLDRWGENNCSSVEAAGVICENTKRKLKNIKPKQSKIKFIKLRDYLNVRLKGGRLDTEGRVEVSYDNKQWGTICGSTWSILEANVVCKNLGYGFASNSFNTDLFGGQNLSSLLLSGTVCQGNETKMSECYHEQFGKVSCPDDSSYVAAVICTKNLPDLIFDIAELEQSLHLEDRMLYFLQCAMEENCLSSEAYKIERNNDEWPTETRRLLKFTAKTLNAGNADFRPHIPKNQWIWHSCHMHFHSMEVFAKFDIYDLRGVKVAEGHKASFCLEDNQCKEGITPKYACANYGDQGISVNCYDIYRYNIDCQWIDITDIDFGYYKLNIAVNPDFSVPEMDYHNNGATCSLIYSPSNAIVYDCKLERP